MFLDVSICFIICSITIYFLYIFCNIPNCIYVKNGGDRDMYIFLGT